MHSNMKGIEDKLALYEGLRPESFKKPIVKGRLSSGFQSYLLACMPKSGSTWFKSVFSCMPKCIAFRAVPAYGAREQETALCGGCERRREGPPTCGLQKLETELKHVFDYAYFVFLK